MSFYSEDKESARHLLLHNQPPDRHFRRHPRLSPSPWASSAGAATPEPLLGAARGSARGLLGGCPGPRPPWREEPTLPAVTAVSSSTSFRPQTQGSPLLGSKGGSRPLGPVCTQGSLQHRLALTEVTARHLGRILKVRRPPRSCPHSRRGPGKAVSTHSASRGHLQVRAPQRQRGPLPPLRAKHLEDDQEVSHVDITQSGPATRNYPNCTGESANIL